MILLSGRRPHILSVLCYQKSKNESIPLIKIEKLTDSESAEIYVVWI